MVTTGYLPAVELPGGKEKRQMTPAIELMSISELKGLDVQIKR